MQRILLARECGEDVRGLDDILSDRWTSLSVDRSRELRAIPAESIEFVDIETANGSLLLWGGSGQSARSGQICGAAGVFRLTSGKNEVEEKLTAFTVDENSTGKALKCGKWFPDDPGLFVTGDARNVVSIWDSLQFQVALQIPLAQGQRGGGEVVAIDMSRAPGARSDLVATCRSDCPTVTLLDLSSGAFTHQLSGHAGTVTDIQWSPTNPYMLVSSDKGGVLRLFDVRRAGNTSCLVEFSEFRKLPNQDWNVFHEPPCTQASKRSRTSGKKLSRHSSKNVNGTALRTMRTSGPLGLGCAWDSTSASQQRRRKRRKGLEGLSSSGGSAHTRVRFTVDGQQLISAGKERQFRLWDVHTGRYISSLCSLPQRGGEGALFDMARDNQHVLTALRGGLQAIEMDSGTVLPRQTGHSTSMVDMAVHPFWEEVYTASENQILSWSSTRLPLGKDSPDEK